MNATPSHRSLQADPSRQPARAAATSAGGYRRLFIVTYGRSGSTLLQGALNALPGYLIRGENNNLVGELLELYERLPRHRELQTGPEAVLRSTTPEMPFFGYERFRDETYASGLARLLDTMLVDDEQMASIRCLGFKEIRYTPEDVAAKVDFLRRLYPGCAIVYNIRSPEAVTKSEFQKGKPVEYFRHFNATLRDMAEVDPDAALVRYEDVVAGTGTLPALFEFLGEPFDERALRNARAFASVLGKKHSYHSSKKGSFYSNVPAQAQVAAAVPGLDLLVVDKMTVKRQATTLEGFVVAAPGSPPPRFGKLLDAQGRPIKFEASYDLPSPRMAKKLGAAAAAKSRFTVTFKRSDAEDCTLYLASDHPAVTILADRSL